MKILIQVFNFKYFLMSGSARKGLTKVKDSPDLSIVRVIDTTKAHSALEMIP